MENKYQRKFEKVCVKCLTDSHKLYKKLKKYEEEQIPERLFKKIRDNICDFIGAMKGVKALRRYGTYFSAFQVYNYEFDEFKLSDMTINELDEVFGITSMKPEYLCLGSFEVCLIEADEIYSNKVIK